MQPSPTKSRLWRHGWELSGMRQNLNHVHGQCLLLSTTCCYYMLETYIQQIITSLIHWVRFTSLLTFFSKAECFVRVSTCDYFHWGKSIASNHMSVAQLSQNLHSLVYYAMTLTNSLKMGFFLVFIHPCGHLF